MEAVPSFVARVAVTCTCMRNCETADGFVLSILHARNTSLLLNSNLFKLFYNLVFKPSACTASSLSSYFAIQDAEEVVYCIFVSISSPHRPLKRFKSPHGKQGKFQ